MISTKDTNSIEIIQDKDIKQYVVLAQIDYRFTCMFSIFILTDFRFLKNQCLYFVFQVDNKALLKSHSGGKKIIKGHKKSVHINFKVEMFGKKFLIAYCQEDQRQYHNYPIFYQVH